MLVSGMRAIDVAAAIGCTRQAVSAWIRDPDFSAELSRQREIAIDEARRSAEVLAHDAVALLADIMRGTLTDPQGQPVDPGPALRRQAAVDILDRVGLGRVSTARHEGGDPDRPILTHSSALVDIAARIGAATDAELAAIAWGDTD